MIPSHAAPPPAPLAAFLDTLDHPRKGEVRRLVALLAADPRLVPGIKWNAPSFAAQGRHCITQRIAPKDTLQLVFHRDARSDSTPFAFADPTSLLAFKAPDRAVLDLKGRPLAALEQDIATLARAWVDAMTS